MITINTINSCATNKVDSESPPYITVATSYNDFINNNKSMTKQLENFSNNLTVDVIYSGDESGEFMRIVALKLESVPVLIGISKTKPEDSIFYQIIANANEVPIGRMLFANPDIRRAGMEVSKVDIHDLLNNESLQTYLSHNEIESNSMLDIRKSKFIYEEQTMELQEIILPKLFDKVHFAK